MWGALIGDSIGSAYEHTDQKNYDLNLLSTPRTLTDDTVLMAATADALLNQIPFDQAYRKWGNRYPNAGFNSSVESWLLDPGLGPNGSRPNHAAVRAIPIGWHAESTCEALELAKQSATCSHDHEEGVKGAQAVALAVLLARTGSTADEITQEIETRFGYRLTFDLDQLHDHCESTTACAESVPQALYIALSCTSFEDGIRKGLYIGDNTDTICTIVGGIVECLHPWPLPERLESAVRLKLQNNAPDMLKLIDKFTEAVKLANLKARLAEGDASLARGDLIDGEQFFRAFDLADLCETNERSPRNGRIDLDDAFNSDRVQQRAAEWREQNQEAIQAYNELMKERGVLAESIAQSSGGRAVTEQVNQAFERQKRGESTSVAHDRAKSYMAKRKAAIGNTKDHWSTHKTLKRKYSASYEYFPKSPPAASEAVRRAQKNKALITNYKAAVKAYGCVSDGYKPMRSEALEQDAKALDTLATALVVLLDGIERQAGTETPDDISEAMERIGQLSQVLDPLNHRAERLAMRVFDAVFDSMDDTQKSP